MSCLKLNYSEKVLHVVLVVNMKGKTIILVNIYGYNSKLENDELLHTLDSKLAILTRMFPNAYFIVGGDFNIVLNDAIDRWSPAKPSQQNASLKHLIDKYDLSDVWREKFPNNSLYTWSNKNGTRQSCLDYWLVSKTLCKDNITINVLPTLLTKLTWPS